MWVCRFCLERGRGGGGSARDLVATGGLAPGSMEGQWRRRDPNAEARQGSQIWGFGSQPWANPYGFKQHRLAIGALLFLLV